MMEKRSWSIALSLILIAYSFAAWLSIGYLDLWGLVLVWILLVTAGLILVNAAIPFSDRTRDFLIYFSIFISLLLVIAISKVYVTSNYEEDEIAIQKYAAILFLHGKDPYIKANMIGLYEHYRIPLFETPLLTGGNVYFLLYPGLAVLLVIPAVIFKFSVDYIIVFFNFLSILLLIYYYKKNDMKMKSPLIIVVIMVSAFYIGFAVAGVSSIIWVFFLAAAYVFRKKPYLAGMFYGLSLGYKQDAVIIIPFLIYFLYREYGKGNVIRFLSITILSFLAVNLPFIVMNPYAWLISVISIGNQNIIGVSTGPSILAFAGFVNIPPSYFTALLAVIAIFLLYVYIKYYDAFRYAFFAFPVLIMLVNYRLMISYMMYWPYLVILSLPDIGRMKITIKPLKINKKAFAVLSVVIIAISASFAVTSSEAPGHLEIEKVYGFSDKISVPGIISSMNISIYYDPPYGGNSSIPVNFRIFLSEGLKNFDSNSLLWHTDTYIVPGWNNITIYPDGYFDMLPANVSFRIEAYYSSLSGFLNCNAVWGMPVYPMENPEMMYPSYITSSPFPGWSFTSHDGNFSYIPDGIILNSGGYANLTTDINISELKQGNYRLLMNVSGTGNYGYYVAFGNQKYIVTPEKITTPAGIFGEGSMTSVNFSEIGGIAEEYGWNMNDVSFGFFSGASSHEIIRDTELIS